MNIEDYNYEHENSDEDEESIPLAAVVDDENEDNRKMPALPVLLDKKSKSESATNEKQKNRSNKESSS